MGDKHGLNAHAVFGDTNRADSVPDCLVSQNGPAYLEGRLVLSLSFQGSPIDAQMEDAGDLVECHRLWDDLAEEWYGCLEVLRFEWMDIVVRLTPKPVILWKGSINTRARVVSVPDLNDEGMAANQRHDLCWRRV